MAESEMPEKVINVVARPLNDYVFNVVVSFNQGISELVIKGRGKFISKAVDVYNALLNRLGDSIELIGVNIGSERFKGRRRAFIAIKIRHKS
ncbi:MAG: DNA-binding protein [Desulfurococcaceae archaeon]